MWHTFGEYQLNRFGHIQQKSSGGVGSKMPPSPAQILMSLNVEIGIFQPLQPALQPLHLSQPWYLQPLQRLQSSQHWYL